MTILKFGVAAVLGATLFASESVAQVMRVDRGAHAEEAFVVEDEFVDRIVDESGTAELGVGEFGAEVATDRSSCFASQSTVAMETGNSMVVEGSLAVGSAQLKDGVHCLFHSWASVVVTFVVESAGSYRLHGLQSENASAKLDLFNWETGEHRLVEIPIAPLEFEYSDVILEPGTYHLAVFLDHLCSSQEESSRSESLEFGLEVNPSDTVSAEQSSWGAVKSLYR